MQCLSRIILQCDPVIESPKSMCDITPRRSAVGFLSRMLKHGGLKSYHDRDVVNIYPVIQSHPVIRIGPDRAYPLHFTRPQLLLLLPVLLPVLLLLPLLYPLYFTHPHLLLLLLFFYLFGPYPLK